MLSVLFLDIDGVLNSRAFLLANPEADVGTADQIDPLAVARLNEIVRETGCKVVISSSWRHRHAPSDIAAMLDARGFAYSSRIIGGTPARLSNYYRANEIRWWLYDHPDVESFVAIDDDGDADFDGRLVRTRFDDGLQDRHIEQAVALLRTPWRRK